MSDLIDLYYWPTPNGWKITIMLEELAAPYRVNLVDLVKGEQFEPAFLKLSPNNRIPALIDPRGPNEEPISVDDLPPLKHDAFTPQMQGCPPCPIPFCPQVSL
ncbi:glutathione S-transferase N-terminal domain-containing protein [Gluconobacter cerinus]|uniref:GST N-terminal domain-containing protein n=1 Tax=Gluconobacter cerinus TaxID=38307 RepID=A0AAV5NBU3_9PROT|nr:glutathione S-transferase N-terminal domain-containing protein [Gluconobacter cerinus]GLQ61515.1 hypothetical protein GCM10007867_03600 [Gluconobacter cerinus]